MPDYKRSFAESILEFLRDNGIDPGHAAALMSLVILISYRKEFSNWKNIPKWKKSLAKSSVFAATALSLISLLRILGIMKF